MWGVRVWGFTASGLRALESRVHGGLWCLGLLVV